MAKEIPLSKGYFAIVDDEDYEKVSRHKWNVSIVKRNNNYQSVHARRYFKNVESGLKYGEGNGKSQNIYMSHFILGLPKGTRVMFKNGNRLDCQKENMIPAKWTCITRHCKTYSGHDGKPKASIYRGVTHDKKAKYRQWRARIIVNKKAISIGVFKFEIDAAHAYDKAAVKYFGRCASLNFPEDKEILMIQVHGTNNIKEES